MNQSLSGAQLVLERDPTIVLTLPHHHHHPLAPVAYSTTKDQINRAMSSAVQIGRYYLKQGLFNNMASTAVVVQGQCKLQGLV